MRFDPSEYEPLLTDQRLEQVVGKLKSKYGHRRLEDFEFVTFIQPARPVTQTTPEGIEVRTFIEEMAVFAALTPRPFGPKGGKLMTAGTVSLRDWMSAEKEAGHFVGAKDHAFVIYTPVVAEALAKYDSAKELIH